MKLYSKHPDAKLDYSIDWSDFLDGDDIEESEWGVQTFTGDTAPVTKSDEAVSGDTSVVWLEAGELGREYLISNSIVTADGREDVRSFILKIETT